MASSTNEEESLSLDDTEVLKYKVNGLHNYVSSPPPSANNKLENHGVSINGEENFEIDTPCCNINYETKFGRFADDASPAETFDDSGNVSLATDDNFLVENGQPQPEEVLLRRASLDLTNQLYDQFISNGQENSQTWPPSLAESRPNGDLKKPTDVNGNNSHQNDTLTQTDCISSCLDSEEENEPSMSSEHNSSPRPSLSLKAKPSAEIRVQFETPFDLGVKECLLSQNEKEKVQKSPPGRPLWSRSISSDTEAPSPLSRNFRNSNRRRRRQTSGSSGNSIESSNSSDSGDAEFERRAPDGGWGWVVVAASFLVHCIADGVTMSFGVLYVEFLNYFGESKSLTSWVGSLFMAIPLLAGPLASLLTDRYGCRLVTIWGSVIACIGFLLGAFAPNIVVLFLTVGVLTGLGLAVCYVAAIVIVAFYFERYRSLATGIAVAGSGIGTFVFAPLIQYLTAVFAWRGCLILLAGIFLNMAVCGALMRDLEWTRRRVSSSSETSAPRRPSSNASRQYSVAQYTSSESLGVSAAPRVAASTTLPSLGELRRLVESGETALECGALSGNRNLKTGRLVAHPHPVRSESLLVLPTFLNKEVPRELLPCLWSHANAYEVVSHVYPHLLLPPLRTMSRADVVFCNGQTKEEKTHIDKRHLNNGSVADDSHLKEVSDESFKEKESHEKETLMSNGVRKSSTSSLDRNSKIESAVVRRAAGRTQPKLVPCRRTSCVGGEVWPVAQPLRDMRVTRQSMTFRGAMLNIHRYRLRASSCPNIFRNSIITIANTQNQSSWSYWDDLVELLWSCFAFDLCRDLPLLVFAMSNFVLYVFYDTVYMYLTDYAIGVGITTDTATNLISAIGFLNCIGMVMMGYMGDQPWCSPLLVYNVSMVACGMAVVTMPFLTSYWLLVSAAAVFGLFISANYALTAVILVQLISLEAFSRSYGFLLLVQGVANLIGPPLVGFMADATGDYTIPFVVSGLSIIVSGLMLSLIPALQRAKRAAEEDSDDEASISSNSHTFQRNPAVV